MILKEDNGSAEWLDQLAHTRIRQGRQGVREAYAPAFDPRLDRKISVEQPAAQTKDYAYQHRPHHIAAHIQQQKEFNDTAFNMVNQIPIGAPSMPGLTPDNVDTELMRYPAHVRNRLMGTMQQLQQGQSAFPEHNLAQMGNVSRQQQQALGMQQPQQQQQTQVCRLQEGYTFFRAMQTQGFGATVPLVRPGGSIPGNISSTEFQIKGIRNVYIIPPQQTVVDMAQIQANPQMLTQLVEVTAPMVGTFLVPREAIMGGQQQGQPGGQQILRDSRYSHQQPQQQQYHHNIQQQQMVRPQQQQPMPVPGNNINRRILRG